MNAITHVARGSRGRNLTIALRARFTVVALVLAVLAAMANGASYVLADTPPAANELVFACSVLHRVADIVETSEGDATAHPHLEGAQHL
jgi:hypothetical protein